LLLLSGQIETYSAEFDRKTLQRITVSHGNQGTHNFSLLKVPVASYAFQIHGIDNSFVGSGFGSGLCSGVCSGQSASGCLQIETHTIALCDDAPVTLPSPQAVLWFSFDKGFLGEFDSLMADGKTDTIFSFSHKKTAIRAM